MNVLIADSPDFSAGGSKLARGVKQASDSTMTLSSSKLIVAIFS